MLGNSPLKKVIRLSRFSQNINMDFLKTLNLTVQKSSGVEKDDNLSTNLIDSYSTSKRSILLDEKRNSKEIRGIQDGIKQNKQDAQQLENSTNKKHKFYSIQQINKFKESLLELPYLYEKPKKYKQQHIHPEFIRFLFQILKNQDFITKIFDSYVPHDSVVSEFIGILHGFQQKQYSSGKIIQINKNQSLHFIFIQGAAEKLTVKETTRQSRKSICQPSIQNSLVRRSKIKNKTVTQKNKIMCFENQEPIFINEADFSACTLKTLGRCKLILLQKQVWSKFISALQKLQEKYLMNFIKHSTTINLAVYTQKQKQSQKEKDNKQKDVLRKTFLHDMKYPEDNQAESSNQSNDIFKGGASVKKGTIYTGSLTLAYKLLSFIKDQTLFINNQDVYLIVKGSVFLDTDKYSIIINEGSIINSFILLNLEYQQVKIKTLADTLVVKLILQQIYFRKEDEIQFIQKLKQIESFRRNVYGKTKIDINKCTKNLNQVSQYANQSCSAFQKQKYSMENTSKSKFQPDQLKLKQLNFNKGSNQLQNTHKNTRISHKRNYNTQESPRQSQLARKVAVKYANNYCIFQKIVQSQQKVVQKFNLNRVNKIFPIQALLRNINFNKGLQIHQNNQNNSNSKSPNNNKKVNFSKLEDSQLEKQNIAESWLNYGFDKKSTKSSKSSKKSRKDLKSLQKRRQKFQKNKVQRKMKEKAKVIDNLFEINKTDNPTQTDLLNKQKSIRKSNLSLEFHKQRIKQIININQQMKLKQLYSQRNYISFKPICPMEESLKQISTRSNQHLHKSSYKKNFMITQPAINCSLTNQRFIYGQNQFQKQLKSMIKAKRNNLHNLTSQNVFHQDFIKFKKKKTNRIKTSMLTGRIRESKYN